MDQAGVDCKPLAAHQSFQDATRYHRFKHVSQEITVPEAAMH